MELIVHQFLQYFMEENMRLGLVHISGVEITQGNDHQETGTEIAVRGCQTYIFTNGCCKDKESIMIRIRVN